MLLVALFGAAVALSNAPSQLLLIPSLGAYAFFTIGGYRLIRGKEPAPAHAAEISYARIVLGCISVIFCFALFIGLVLIAAAIFDK